MKFYKSNLTVNNFDSSKLRARLELSVKQEKPLFYVLFLLIFNTCNIMLNINQYYNNIFIY